MSLRVTIGVFAAAALLVSITRWPFRSRFLFSWDSANYALAIVHIDIQAHRPHPPGYLGLVLAGRALTGFFGDPNAALIAWNLIAAAIATALAVTFARRIAAGEPRPLLVGITAGVGLLTSPLFWFYNDVAEIYTSELLVSLLVAYSAWHAVSGRPRALYACFCAVALAAVFKLSAALLMLPLAAWASYHTPRRIRVGALLLFGGLACTVTLGFFLVEPDFLAVLTSHFVGATAGSRLIGGETSIRLAALNRNVRDVLTATGAALGPVNVVALALWAIVHRSFRPAFNARFVALWSAPWLIVFTFVHVGKPGYILPLLPIGCVILGLFLSRLRLALAVGVIGLQIVVNVLYFTQVKPFSDAQTGGNAAYRTKNVWQRVASDLEPLTFPTVHTIRVNDANTLEFKTFIARACPAADPIVFVGVSTVDWRRVMWYLPAATAVYEDQQHFTLVGKNTEFVAMPPTGLVLESHCPIVWLTDDAHAADMRTAAMAIERKQGLGWLTPPARLSVTAEGVTFGNN